jgi:phosphoglycerate dehydrogenase-like enzyme
MRRAIGFGMKVIAHDPYFSDSPRTSRFPQVEFVELDDVFRRSRIVSIHAPNQPDTVHLVNARRLATMRPDAWLINTSRGELIDESALIAALHAKQIAGAAIDVYQMEPLPDNHPLRGTPGLLLTPHNAFNSIEAAVRMSDGCAQSILEILENRKIQNIWNPQVLERPNLRFKSL